MSADRSPGQWQSGTPQRQTIQPFSADHLTVVVLARHRANFADNDSQLHETGQQVLVQGLLGNDRYVQSEPDASPPNRLTRAVMTAMWSGWPVCPLLKRQAR